jgi:predicted nuclease of predicted toxin-antitoxin system
MTFLLDQDVPDAIARVVQQAGHESLRLREALPVESADDAVLAFAQSRAAVLVTCNRDDFLSLAKTRPHSGIVILIRRESRVLESSRFLRLLQTAGEAGIRNNINFA